MDWLMERLAPLAGAGAYIVFDCPGQVGQRPAKVAAQKGKRSGAG
jgi:hypothetical protein